MTAGAWIVLGVALCPLVGLATLTAWGSRRRGNRPGFAVLCGLLFPATWVAWYVRDKRDNKI